MAQNKSPPTTISNVYYYVPQDKDDPEIPNAFCIPLKLEDIRIADIQKYFPLSGEYIFRFKYRYSGSVVWMDIPPSAAKLPFFDGRIILKATRRSWERINSQDKVQASNEIQKSQPQQMSEQKNIQQYQQQQSQPSKVQNSKEINLFEDDDEKPAVQKQFSSQGSLNSTNLLDF